MVGAINNFRRRERMGITLPNLQGNPTFTPIVSSTPLKPSVHITSNISNYQTKSFNQLQDSRNQENMHDNRKQQIKQRYKKRAVSKIFDVSSSDDDENISVGKFNLELNSLICEESKITEKSKILQNNFTEKLAKNLNVKKNDVKGLKKSHNKPLKNLKKKNLLVLKSSNKSAKKILEPGKELKNEKENSTVDKSELNIEQDQVIDEGFKSNKTKEKALDSQKKLETYFLQIKSNCNESTKNESNFSNPSHKKLKVDGAQENLKSKNQVKFDVSNSIPVENNFVLMKKESIIKSVPSKRKQGKTINGAVSAKKSKLKESTQKRESLENIIDSPHVVNQKNMSHQLFSDSKGQELLNALDLTCEDGNKQSNKNLFENEKDNILQVSCKIKVDSKCVEKKINEAQTQVIVSELNVKTDEISDFNKRKEKVQSKCNSNKNKNAVFSSVSNNPDHTKANFSSKNFNKDSNSNEIKCDEKKVHEKLSDSEGKKVNKNEKSSKGLKRTRRNNQKPNEINAIKDGETNFLDERGALCLTDSSLPGVFKLFNSLHSLDQYETGFIKQECWSLKNFKCGVFKLHPKSQQRSRTIHEDSYLGGIVFRGLLNVKIGDSECELGEGDMIFVPPLTNWQAKNCQDQDAVVYYWTGRF